MGRREWAGQFSDTEQVQWVRLPVTCIRRGLQSTRRTRKPRTKERRKERTRSDETPIWNRHFRLTGKLQSVIRLRVPAYSGHLREKLSLWTQKRHVGEWNRSIRPIILNLGTRWGAVVRFTPRPLYPGVRAPPAHSLLSWKGPREGLPLSRREKSLHLPQITPHQYIFNVH